jgi:hypothetical protein
VTVVGDYRLLQLPDEDRSERSIQRMNPVDLPASLRQVRVVAAYRYLNRLRLRLALQRIDPYVKSASAVWLQVDPQAQEFSATCTLELLRGSITEVSFRWPGWRDAGWSIESIEGTPGLDPRLLDDATQPDRLRIEFAEPARKEVVVAFRARRALHDGTTSAQILLPVAETSARSPTLLAVLNPENIEVELQPAAGTVLRPQAEAASRVIVPPEFQKLHRDGYRIESNEVAFTAAIVVHPREVTTLTRVEASQRPGTVAVRQRISYDVAYGSLPQPRFIVPRGLRMGQLRVYDGTGRELAARAGDGADGQVRIALDPPGRGRFELELRYAVEAPTSSLIEGDLALTIPVVLSADAEFTSTEFQWRDAAGRDATITGDDWTRETDTEGSWVWKLPRPAREIGVVLSRTAGAWRGAAVSRALIRSAIGADGTIHTRVEYRLTGAALDLSIRFSPGVQPVAVWWDHRSLRLPAPQIDATGSARYEILPDRNSAAEPILTIETLRRGGGTQIAEPRAFLSIPLGDMITFAALVGAAVALRRRADAHKRLMLLATITILTAAVARFLAQVNIGGTAFIFLGTDLFVLAVILYDFTSRGTIHPASLWGGALVVVFKPLLFLASGTSAWHSFADALR